MNRHRSEMQRTCRPRPIVWACRIQAGEAICRPGSKCHTDRSDLLGLGPSPRSQTLLEHRRSNRLASNSSVPYTRCLARLLGIANVTCIQLFVTYCRYLIIAVLIVSCVHLQFPQVLYCPFVDHPSIESVVSLTSTFNSTLLTTTPDTCMQSCWKSSGDSPGFSGSSRFGYHLVRQHLDHTLLIDPDEHRRDTTKAKQTSQSMISRVSPRWKSVPSHLLFCFLPCFSELHHRRDLHQGHRCFPSADL
jgi:hypothetical protein